MASIERTAYPRFPRTLTLKDLQTSFTPRPEETEWAYRYARRPERRLALLVLLKCFQFLRYFPAVDAIPVGIVEHVSATLGMPPAQSIEYPGAHTALYRHHKAIRDLLGVQPYTDAQTRQLAIRIAQEAAGIVQTRDVRADPPCIRGSSADTGSSRSKRARSVAPGRCRSLRPARCTHARVAAAFGLGRGANR